MLGSPSTTVSPEPLLRIRDNGLCPLWSGPWFVPLAKGNNFAWTFVPEHAAHTDAPPGRDAVVQPFLQGSNIHDRTVRQAAVDVVGIRPGQPRQWASWDVVRDIAKSRLQVRPHFWQAHDGDAVCISRLHFDKPALVQQLQLLFCKPGVSLRQVGGIENDVHQCVRAIELHFLLPGFPVEILSQFHLLP